MMTEQLIQKNILTMLKRDYDAYVVKVMTASVAGVPDILCCIQGLFIGIEVKRPESKGNVSKLQAYNLSSIEKAGGHALVAWSVAQVREFIEEIL